MCRSGNLARVLPEAVTNHLAKRWQPSIPRQVCASVLLRHMQFQDWLHSILVLTISVWAQEKLNLLAVSGTPVRLYTLTVPRKQAVDCRTGQSRPLVHYCHPLVLLLLIVCHKLTFWLHSKNKMGDSMTHRSKITFGFLGRALRRTGGLDVFTWLSELCLIVVVPSAAEVFMFRSAFSDDVCPWEMSWMHLPHRRSQPLGSHPLCYIWTHQL